MTRIVGGRWGGRRLATPAGDTTRPTSEKVRAALASSLTATGGLDGARVLDLYAGSGALGLELVSRGASSAVFVEHDRAALVALRANVTTLGTASTRDGSTGSPPALTVIPGEVVGRIRDHHVERSGRTRSRGEGSDIAGNDGEGGRATG